MAAEGRAAPTAPIASRAGGLSFPNAPSATASTSMPNASKSERRTCSVWLLAAMNAIGQVRVARLAEVRDLLLGTRSRVEEHQARPRLGARLLDPGHDFQDMMAADLAEHPRDQDTRPILPRRSRGGGDERSHSSLAYQHPFQ